MKGFGEVGRTGLTPRYRLVGPALIALGVLIALAFTQAGSAQAAYTPGTALPTPGLGFGPSGVAVNQSTRDVYAARWGNSFFNEKGAIYRFNSSGTNLGCTLSPEPSFPGAVAVNPVNNDIYVEDVKSAATESLMRTYPAACGTEIGTAFAVRASNSKAISQSAVDSEGNIYFPNSVDGKLEKITPTGTKTVLVEGLTNPMAAALDNEGDVYVTTGAASCTNNTAGRLKRYDVSGTLPKLAAEGVEPVAGLTNVTSVDFDLSAEELFIGRGCGKTKGLTGGFRVEKYTPGGTKLTEFGGSETFGDAGSTIVLNQIAVDETSGKVFAADAGNAKVQVFEPGPKVTLTVSTSNGGGTGIVKTADSRISCAPTCVAEFEVGEPVTLEGVADPGSKFNQWNGGTGSATACNGTTSAQCTFTIEATTSINGEFGAGGNKLEVTNEGTGTGTVISTPAGIDCGTECEAFFTEGASVILTAAPDAHSEFGGWGIGDCEEEPSPAACKVTMSAAKDVHATFTLKTHTITVVPTGSGKVSADSGTISECEESGGVCSGSYGEGTTVVLTAIPAANHEVTWGTGDCDEVLGPNGTQCKLEVPEGNATIEADFTLEKHLLTVVKEGGGQGTVTGSGINCGVDCEEEYDHGTMVTLTQAPTPPDSEFDGWTGCDQVLGPEEEECKVEMDSAKTVNAKFSAGESFNLTVVKEGTGTGTVTSEPPGINCGTECEHEFEEEEVVVLTGAPGLNSQAATWTGCDEVITENKCKVEMDADKTVHATFALESHTLTVVPANVSPGSGEVNAGSGAISGCKVSGGTCSGSYTHGTSVTLTAVPSTHSKVEWGASECQSNPTENQCVVEMSAAKTVHATFSVKTHSFTLHTGGGTGTGAVKCNGAACISVYPEGTVLQLTALPDPHNSFAGWSVSGNPGTTCTGTMSPCTVTVDADITVDATFTRITHSLTVIPVGAGSVSAGSGAISGCEEGGGVCSGTYNEGATVQLTATPPAHQQAVWTGCDSSTGTTCTLEIPDDDAEVTATFVAITHTLTVDKQGAGSGSVTCDGGACASSYAEGSVVTLHASADSGSSFAGWSGAGCSGSGDCTLTVDGDKTVTATFDKNSDGGPPVQPPPPPPPGQAIVPSSVPVQGNKAMVELDCKGAGDCSGVLKLFAKLPVNGGKNGKRRHLKSASVLIGKASFSLAAGTSKTVKVKITNRKAKQLLNQGKKLKADVKGSGVKPRKVNLRKS